MFYYRNWQSFCSELLKNRVMLCTASQSLRLPNSVRFVVLKHDVEAAVNKAYRLAEIEHKLGICGSYYVQAYLLEKDNNVRMLQEMQAWGHEISYHYDVLDAHAGDYEAAEIDFKCNLKRFADCGFHFSTICQHGNPVKNRVGYTSNRDFFRHPAICSRYSDLTDMVVNYSKHIDCDYQYISDAGYGWNIITEPETNDLHLTVKNVRLNGFTELKELIVRSDCSFVVSTHPHRWTTSAWTIKLKIMVFNIVRRMALIVRHIPCMKGVMNKFYFLAKHL